MKANPLEQRLLSVYRQAVRQSEWAVADYLLAALEACQPPEAAPGGAVAEAYRVLAAKAVGSDLARPKGSGT